MPNHSSLPPLISVAQFQQPAVVFLIFLAEAVRQDGLCEAAKDQNYLATGPRRAKIKVVCIYAADAAGFLGAKSLDEAIGLIHLTLDERGLSALWADGPCAGQASQHQPEVAETFVERSRKQEPCGAEWQPGTNNSFRSRSCRYEIHRRAGRSRFSEQYEPRPQRSKRVVLWGKPHGT